LGQLKDGQCFLIPEPAELDDCHHCSLVGNGFRLAWIDIESNLRDTSCGIATDIDPLSSCWNCDINQFIFYVENGSELTPWLVFYWCCVVNNNTLMLLNIINYSNKAGTVFIYIDNTDLSHITSFMNIYSPFWKDIFDFGLHKKKKK
jgi:hypothetical protein